MRRIPAHGLSPRIDDDTFIGGLRVYGLAQIIGDLEIRIHLPHRAVGGIENKRTTSLNAAVESYKKSLPGLSYSIGDKTYGDYCILVKTDGICSREGIKNNRQECLDFYLAVARAATG
ncbi:hypothetical protein [Bifidobacterium vansinderenii]|uniref:Uncharacterized protein n=1 Tax=Bifidobacterium vansinderenii TaxID=1984871 RepID=A0A229VVJ4_9BIFI|nr:hypothetical protein [Bifidobacterium vansinderenii]OXM99636.1 hypothetical protein Tam10B_2113 [Bifidobacterium vansinderenii]